MDILRTFGPVWDGAGVRGLFGEGYAYHRFIPGLNFTGSTFVAKTSTWLPRKGNLELTSDYRPQHLFPDCIWVDLRRGLALNAVGLSGPGFRKLADTGLWQAITEPFFLSFMPVAETENEQFKEVESFVRYLRERLPEFAAYRAGKLGLQFNLTCPNVGLKTHELIMRARGFLALLKLLGIPVVFKLNTLTPPELAAELAANPVCAGLCVSNSLPFGTGLPKEWWHCIFPDGSPLGRRGLPEGGLSGAPLLHEVDRWLKDFRALDRTTHVNTGGGILHPRDVSLLRRSEASSVFFASAAILRPWRVKSIIRRAHELA